MRDEAAALCDVIDTATTFIRSSGLEVRSTILGITSVPPLGFDCVEDTVVSLLGDTIPGNGNSCSLANGTSPEESWGPSTAIVAQRFDWVEGATRIIVPMADEGPCDGSFPDGCNNPGDDRDSIDTAIAAATANNVTVSPILGTGFDVCAKDLALLLADQTGGMMIETQDPQLDIVDGIDRIVDGVCMPDLSCDDGEPCTVNDSCRQGVCVGRPVSDCTPCDTALDCEDFSVCTDNACVDNLCVWTPNYDTQTQCCDPGDGSLTPLDDEDDCTDDVCDLNTGVVTHPFSAEGKACDDGRSCTVEDVCDGGGLCQGMDVGILSCESDEDCLGHRCDVDRGACFCDGAPELCLTPVPGSLPRSGCYSAGEEVVVLVELASNERSVVGGQFSIGYDPAALRFVSVAPGRAWDPNSVFALELDRRVDETIGRVFYAVGIPFVSQGSKQAAVMAAVHFEAIGTCTDAQICFNDSNPFNTVLTDNSGKPVSFVPCCSSGITINGTPPELTCPQSAMLNADAGLVTALVEWQPPVGSSGCGGPLEVSCSATRSDGVDVSGLKQTGGVHPEGMTQYACEAIDSCGATASCDWDVDVFDFNSLEIELETDSIRPGVSSTRCVEIELFSGCDVPPIVRRRNVTFTGNGPVSLSLSVPIDDYSCISVRDPMHSLRSTGDLQIINGKYVASFTGSPASGGNALQGGDLNDDGVVDVIDLAIATSPPDTNPGVDSPCGTPPFHADLTGDGVVDAADVAVVEANLDRSDAPACCTQETAGSVGAKRSETTVKQLTSYGVKNATALDVNRDGVVQASEVLRYARRKADPVRSKSSRGNNAPIRR